MLSQGPRNRVLNRWYEIREMKYEGSWSCMCHLVPDVRTARPSLTAFQLLISVSASRLLDYRTWGTLEMKCTMKFARGHASRDKLKNCSIRSRYMNDVDFMV